MRKVKIAVVGCGGISNWHLSHTINFEDVEFVGFCDLIPERADAMVAKTGMGKRYDNYVQMLDEAQPEALYICVPPHAHGELEFEAIKRGIHFLVEKPMALDMALAYKINEAVAKAGIITAVGFQDRYLDVVAQTKEYLKDRKIGLVYGAWVGGVPMVPWWRKYETSGGQIVEQNIHLYDGLRYIIGEPDRVYCSAGKGLVTGIEGYNVDDYSSAVITFKNGVVATMFTACYTGEGVGMQNGLSFVTTDARIEYNLRHSVKLITRNGVEEIKSSVDQGITEDRTFINAVKTNNATIIRSPYSDAIKSLAFTMACNESIKTGKEIKL
ncbi:MAG: oxidoreductase domain protein [Clostridia bacterium]|jgi:predicted dehydrogenase|nr:oxidoreductase domain protein [Clostridia bacterium]